MRRWEMHLHDLADSFPSGKTEPPLLRPGNYLFVQAQNSYLSVKLWTMGPMRYQLLNNGRDASVLLHSIAGTPVRDADVYVGRRRIGYDTATGTYPLGRWRKTRQVKVVYQGALYFFLITGSYSSYRPQTHWWHLRRPEKVHSFLVLSKPKYKPGDTVQGKTFITHRNGDPVHRPLILRLHDPGANTDTILATLLPYRPGGYVFSFVLNDSLDLSLDEEYTVTLEEEMKRKKNNRANSLHGRNYRDEEDPDEIATHRKVLSRGTFRYEEYDLAVVKLYGRVDREKHGPGEQVSVFLQAIDENDLPVSDARVEIQVTTGDDARKFQAESVFIKDTLWRWAQPLDPVGETRIILPDSIFPAASISYTINCTVLNSNNELHSQSFSQYYEGDSGRIFFHPHNDSLDIEYLVRGHSQKTPATLYFLTPNDDTREIQQLSLPVHLPVNVYTSRYLVSVKGFPDSLTDSYKINNHPPLSFAFNRTRDSAQFRIYNPWRLNFWYTLSMDGHIIREGYTDNLDYRARPGSGAPYLLRVQYIWAGVIMQQDFTAPFREKLLRVEIKEPALVYPGEKATISIGVKDADGRPVADADLTAWSWTSKFTDVREPGIPYLGRNYRIKPRHDYTIQKENKTPQTTAPLVWSRWSRQLGLDTIEYYKFLNPATVYVNTEPVATGETQLAPFVSRKGQLVPIELLYIDERLVFYSQSQQLLRYSFRLEPGRHSLRIRIQDEEIRLDSLRAEKDRKTFICINDDTANKAVRFIKMPDTLTRREKELLRHSMLFLENSFDDNLATITQGSDRRYLLNYPGPLSGSASLLVGPLSDGNALLHVEDRFDQSFQPEGGYLFGIQPGLIKEKQWPASYSFYSLSAQTKEYNLNDQALTRKMIDSLWQDLVDERSANSDLFRNENLGAYGNGRLHIGQLTDSGGKALFVKKIFLLRYNDPDFMRIYKGTEKNLGFVQPDTYRLLLLLKGGRYLLLDSVRVHANGLNYYGWGGRQVHAPDSFSLQMDRMLREMERDSYTVYPNTPTANSIQQAFNRHYADLFDLRREVTGKITDDKGQPVQGATVSLKGTSYATVTDQNGLFRLRTSEKGTLVFACLGFTSLEKKMDPGTYYAVKLQPTRGFLQEVVVTGYGMRKRKDMTGSIVTVGNALQGKVAGISIRGLASFTGGPPLILVDGVPFTGTIEQLDPALIVSIDVLKGNDAVSIYGARAALGAIVVTTKKNRQPDIPSIGTPMTGSIIRRHFRDDAFWQPQLHTDANGIASFSVRYPDDITSWKTFAVAFTGDRQSGLAEGKVRAFKPLSANLSLPAFLVKGDKARVIGKVLNYTPDSVTVERHFRINGKAIADSQFTLRNARIDSFLVHPETTDSLHLLYTLKKDDYLDGEERHIPVFPAGVKETRGSFAALEGDTSIRLNFDTALGPVSVYASASLLPVLLDEIENIRSYEYGCNEQIASKLMALLEKKKLYRLMQQEFKEEENITSLITRLLQSRKGSTLWGWWPEAAPSAWVSLHVTEALLAAEKQGYTILLDKQAMIDYLVYSMENNATVDGLFRLRILQQLRARADYSKYIDSLEKRLKNKSLYETLQLQQLRQTAGLETRLDTLVIKRQYTALGNCYWGEDGTAFFDNAIQNTLLMYRLLSSNGGYGQLLKKIRDYLLENRGQGHWRNTYESCLILETLLPDLLVDGHEPEAPRLSINNQPVPGFPYQARIPAGQPMTISQSGKLPVYFTAYQQYLNKSPEKVSGTFVVHSWFEKEGNTLSKLKAGEPVTLQLEVDVKGDADYVLIEIPIPAGCTYQNKSQQYDNQEIHREYFKEKLSIFSQYLQKGSHRFAVCLLPRYTGEYHLNPAKVEMMYFPMLFGREGIKTVDIE